MDDPTAVADALDELDIVAPVVVLEADLHGSHASVAQLDGAASTLVRVDRLAARRVREDALRAAAEEAPERLIEGTTHEVPDGHLDGPRTAAVEVDGLADLPDDLGSSRIDADEVTPEFRQVRQVVAARVPGDTVVGVDCDERRLDARPRHGVPGGPERRVERERVPTRLDRGDLQFRCRRNTRSLPGRAALPAGARPLRTEARTRLRWPRPSPRGSHA